jgi:hypothetical protein
MPLVSQVGSGKESTIHLKNISLGVAVSYGV